MNETEGNEYTALLALQTVNRITRTVNLSPAACWALFTQIRADIRNGLERIARTVEVTQPGSN